MLLAHGGNPNLRDGDQNTVLSKALRAGRLDNASLLLTHGADPNARLEWGRTALIEAAREDRPEEVRLLLAHGADPNLHDEAGATALSVARPAVAEWLLQAGADPNHRDARGRTAFFGAMAEGDPETLRLLVKHGADVQARDRQGRTVLLELLLSRREHPWGFWLRGSHFEHTRERNFSVGGQDYGVVAWLLDLGVPLEVPGEGRDGKARSALEVASRLKLTDVCTLLERHLAAARLKSPTRRGSS